MATVTITVTPVNDAPVAGDDVAVTTEDTAVTTGNVLANDSDVDSVLSPASITAFDAVSANGGAVVNNGDGTFTYTPALNFTGIDTFTYTVSDGALSDVATVTITVTPVNDAPVAGDDVAVTTEDTAVTTGNVLANDSDVDSVLSPASITAFDAVSANGGAVVNNGDGTFTYTPALNFTGIDTFTYTVSDGALSDVATVTITVTPAGVNSVPSLATNAGSTVVQGLTDLITSGELQVTDADNTPAQLIYTVTTAPLNGRLELTTAPGVAITSFTQADIDAGRLVYVHNGAVSTSDSFTFTVSDGAGGTIGATTFTFTVTPFFPPPPPASPAPGPWSRPWPRPQSLCRALLYRLPAVVVPPVLPPPPVLITVVGATDDPVRRAAMSGRKFARVEQPNIVLEEPSVLSLEPLSLPVKTMLAMGHKLAEHLTRLADNLERAMQEREQQAHLLGRVASFSGIALSAGFVAWILHGGSLLASFLVSMPAWRHFDPLPVLGVGERDRRKRSKAREEQEQENKQFRGLDQVLKASAKPAKQQETDRVRRPKS